FGLWLGSGAWEQVIDTESSHEPESTSDGGVVHYVPESGGAHYQSGAIFATQRENSVLRVFAPRILSRLKLIAWTAVVCALLVCLAVAAAVYHKYPLFIVGVPAIALGMGGIGYVLFVVQIRAHLRGDKLLIDSARGMILVRGE